MHVDPLLGIREFVVDELSPLVDKHTLVDGGVVERRDLGAGRGWVRLHERSC